MKTKLFTLLFAIIASIGTISADIIRTELIDGLFYNLDTASHEASVVQPPYKQGFVYDTLKHVVIPETVEYNGITCTVVEIGSNAFGFRSSDNDGCDSLITISIPKTVSKIVGMALIAARGYYIDESEEEESIRFRSSLQSITVDPENPYFSSVDGVLYNKEQTKLIQYPCAKQGGFAIPSTVTSLEEMSFHCCIGLTAIVIPNSITQIKYSFQICTALTAVHFPSSLTNIVGSSFADCYAINAITCEASTPPAIDKYVFWNIDTTACTLYVPAGSVELYRTADNWNTFKNILPIQAQEAAVTEMQAEPTSNSVVIEWPQVDEAVIYTIEIRQNGELICTLSFDENGQLLDVTYAAPARMNTNRQNRNALQTVSGWSYAISGLDANTKYTYTVIARRSDDSEAYKNTITFETPQAGSTDIEGINATIPSIKILRDGQIFILRGEKTYTLQGQEVK